MLTNGPVQIDFLTAEFALQRAGSQTASTAEPGAFAEYLAAVLNPSSQDTHGTHDRRFAPAARSDDTYRAEERPRSVVETQIRDEPARSHASAGAEESPGESASRAESSREENGDATHGDATQVRRPDTDNHLPADADAVDEDSDSEARDARVDGAWSNDRRLMSGLTEGRVRHAADRSDTGDSTAKGADGRSAGGPEHGDAPLAVRFDERGRPLVDLDAEIDLEHRNEKADGADTDGRAVPRPSAAGAGASADAQSAEVGGMALRRRLRAGEDEGREKGDRRDGRGVRRVEIRDLRSRASATTDAGGASGKGRGGSSDGSADGQASFDRSALRPQGASVDASGFHASGEDDSGGESSAHTSASLTSARGSSGPTQASSQSPAHTSTASSQLRHALHDHLNGDIVRAARLIIRDQDSGEIRLHLKPEHLGSVRISLQMQDGHIAGRIIVDNQSVREAFEQNLASLQRAFQESGFEASGVEVSVADSGGQQDGGGGGERAGRPAPGTVADRFGQVVPDLVWFDEQHELVDMVV